MVHPDRPGSWVRFTPGLCTDCRADCCGLPVEVRGEDLVRLGLVDEYQWQDSPSKAARRLVREGVLQSWRGGTGIGILAQKHGRDCLFLDGDRRCTVYEDRPRTCREHPAVGPRPGFCPARKKSVHQVD